MMTDQTAPIAVEVTDDDGADTETHRVRFDPDRSPSVAVVDVVADAANVAPTELAPLASVLDTDALNALVRGSTGASPRGVSLTFTYEGHEVTVRGARG